jgi:dynein heavy chain
MDVYNANSKEKINILIFTYALQHLSRISRIIYKPYGNALLIGLGGTGRKCLTKLACYINNC